MPTLIKCCNAQTRYLISTHGELQYSSKEKHQYSGEVKVLAQKVYGVKSEAEGGGRLGVKGKKGRWGWGLHYTDSNRTTR